MACVVGSSGKPLLPTTEARARKLLKRGRAEILKYRPFTIRMLDREDGDVQPIEYKCDTGYQTIGISICSEKLNSSVRNVRCCMARKDGTTSAESTADADETAKRGTASPGSATVTA